MRALALHAQQVLGRAAHPGDPFALLACTAGPHIVATNQTDPAAAWAGVVESSQID